MKAFAINLNYPKVIHQENAGVTRARARGVEEAADCEFITFVDSDDTISIEYLTQLYNACNDEVDIVINANYAQKFISLKKYIKLLIQGNTSVTLGPVCKLFRKKLFNASTFNIPRSIVVGEDMLMNIRLSFSSQKELVAILNKPEIYYYRPNENSITHCFKNTPKYEHLFQHYLSASIPDERKNVYFIETIKNRLVNFQRFWGYKYRVKEMKKTLFYQELKKDIKTHKYKLPAIDIIIFNYENPIIRFIAINTKKILNKIRRKH